MLNLGFLGVGNDSSTTCQYGGTVVAGNKSAMLKDQLGIETCIGAGSRIAQTALIYLTGKSQKRSPAPRFQFWILQDRNRITETLIRPLVNLLAKNDIQSNYYRIFDYSLQPCKACDRCPDQKTAFGIYQCRINTPKDEFKDLHDLIVQTDVIVPTIFSPVDRTNLASAYQRFLERTRYLRRSDYILSNRVVIPLIFCEIGRNEHFDLRLISSFIRHNTIVHKPLIGMTDNGQLINPEKILNDWKIAIKTSIRLVAGRYHMEKNANKPKYMPLGY
jgi:multimeric flavodoxin WrbA